MQIDSKIDFHVYLSIGIPRSGRYYGEGNGPIRVQSVSCLGSEANITSCNHSSAVTYGHYYDVGVLCQEG